MYEFVKEDSCKESIKLKVVFSGPKSNCGPCILFKSCLHVRMKNQHMNVIIEQFH